MENYLINNKTVALLKVKNKTIIYDVETKRVINKNIKKILEYNCLFYGSDLVGRKKSAAKIINIRYKIPLIINDNIILLQLNSIRCDECLFLVLNKLIDYKVNSNLLEIKCINNTIFNNKISKNSFEKMIINGIKLNNYLNGKKM